MGPGRENPPRILTRASTPPRLRGHLPQSCTRSDGTRAPLEGPVPCDSGPRNHRLPKCRAEAGLRQDGHASTPTAAACTQPGHPGSAPLHGRPPLPSLAGDQAWPLVTHTAPRGTDAILAPDQPIKKSRRGVLARKQACVLHPGGPEPLKPLIQACRGLGGWILQQQLPRATPTRLRARVPWHRILGGPQHSGKP